MAQAGQDLRLALELGAQFGQRAGVHGRVGDQLFQRHGDVQRQIPGAIDSPHPAFAQQTGDTVTLVDDLTGCECHVRFLSVTHRCALKTALKRLTTRFSPVSIGRGKLKFALHWPLAFSLTKSAWPSAPGSTPAAQ